MARSAIPPRAQWNALAEDHPQAANIAFIRELEGMGVSVHVAAVDVVDQAALKQFLDDYRREGWPPLRGVIHSAGIVRDQVLTRMDQATFEAVLHPKMLGGWNLHECFKDTELDFFVLFSSISALVVTVGQSNYASGNAFLDALAHYRRGLGLPAISINWGPWAIGMIAQLNLESLYAQRGIDVILPDHGMQILGHLMGRNPVQGMVVSANWRTVVDSYAIVPRLVVHLATSDESAEAQEGVQLSIKDRLAQVSADERIELLASHCHDAVSRVLRIDSSRLDVETPLNTIGLDSMIAVELRIRLEKSLGAAPTVVEMLRGMSIRNLAQNIARSVEVNLSATVADNEQGEENLEDMLADVDEATLAQLLESIEPQQPVPAGSN